MRDFAAIDQMLHLAKFAEGYIVSPQQTVLPLPTGVGGGYVITSGCVFIRLFVFLFAGYL